MSKRRIIAPAVGFLPLAWPAQAWALENSINPISSVPVLAAVAACMVLYFLYEYADETVTAITAVVFLVLAIILGWIFSCWLQILLGVVLVFVAYLVAQADRRDQVNRRRQDHAIGDTVTAHTSNNIFYHGTPSRQAAINIMFSGGSWLVGNRNKYGSGVYLADFSTAKEYAGRSGAIVEVRTDIPPSQIASYDQVLNSSQFRQWRQGRSAGNLGDDISLFVTEVLGCRFLRTSRGWLVGLVPPNLKQTALSFQGLKALRVLSPQGCPIN